MGFSTSGTVRAWRFTDVEPKTLAQLLDCPVKDAKARLAALARQHADEAWVDAALERLPPAALVALAVLVEHDGMARDTDLFYVARERFGVQPVELVAGVQALLRDVFAITLANGSAQLLALVEPSAARIAERLHAIDLAPLEGAFEAIVDGDGGRALLAACCALGHVDIKVTQSGSPHRAAIKRLAKSIGTAEDQLTSLVELGIQLRLFVTNDDGVLRPSKVRLAAAARGRFPGSPVIDGFCERLRTLGQPITEHHAERWLIEAHERYSRPLDVEALGALPGVRRGTVGAQVALAAAPLEVMGMQAASITPSFEIFIPPESTLEHLVHVLDCAELVRIDRVVVGRITKASIQRAAGAGNTAETILAALRGASRTGVPQNLEAAITDWVASSVHAITATGRVVVVPAAEETRVLDALRRLRPKRLAPGVLVLHADSDRALSNALAKIGVQERRLSAATEDDDDRDVDHRDPHEEDDRDARAKRGEIARPLPPLAFADPILRKRIEEARSGAHPERPRDRVVAETVEPADTSADEIACSADAIRIVEDWEDRHRVTLPDDEALTLACMLDVVSATDRHYLASAKSRKQINDRLVEVLVNRGGMQQFYERHRDVVESIVPPEMLAMLNVGANGSRPRDTKVTWHVHDIADRLVGAAGTDRTYVLDLGEPNPPTVRIHRLAQQGNTFMVLGEDAENDVSIAVPLAAIRRVGEPVAADADAAWRPLAGQTPPAGHVPCPCGSGKRYRACCRAN